MPLYNLFIQPKAQTLLSSSTVHCLFTASASKLERTLASIIWRRLIFAGFQKPIWQTIGCSIQSFFEISGVDQSPNIRVCRSVTEYSVVAISNLKTDQSTATNIRTMSISHLKNDQSTIANNRSMSISHLEDCQTT